MRLRRRSVATLVAGVALLGLAGCQKPVPDVGVYSGGTYLSQPATTYCFTLDDAAANHCRADDPAALEVPVREGSAVGISVPSELSDTPWVVVLSVPGSGAKAQRTPYQIGKSYLSLTPTFSRSARVVAEIVAYRSDGRAVRPVGLWRFEFVRQPKLQTS
jgi:hypothetical protein